MTDTNRAEIESTREEREEQLSERDRRGNLPEAIED